MKRIALLLIAAALLAACGAPSPTLPVATKSTPAETSAPATSAPVETAAPSPTAPAETAAPSPTAPPETALPPTAAPGAGSAVVWVQDGDLWLKRLPDGEPQPLTRLGDVVDMPQFSPDGRLVLFRRQGPSVSVWRDPPEEVPVNTLWAVPAEGGEPRQLIDPLADLPGVPDKWGQEGIVYPSDIGFMAWLPGGRQLLFTSRFLMANGTIGNYDLWRLDVDTGRLDALLPAGQGGMPTLSRDGGLVLLSTPTELTVANADGTDRRLLLAFEPVPTYSEWAWLPTPVWNDDGSALVAIPPTWQVGQPVTYALWRLEPSTGEAAEIGQVQTSWLDTPLWSPDRSRLAYVAADSGLVIAGADGGNPRLVTGGEQLPPVAWSPAGGRLAYSQDGQACVVEDREGAAPACLGPTFAADVRWIDEGRLLLMSSPDGDHAQLIAVDLAAGTQQALWASPPSPVLYDIYIPNHRDSAISP